MCVVKIIHCISGLSKSKAAPRQGGDNATIPALAGCPDWRSRRTGWVKCDEFVSISYLCLIFSLLLTACQSKKPLFEQLTATQTGVHFNNAITPNDSLHVVSFTYLYNGGGVGVGDFDGDGRQDLFFSGNQVSSKLYLNKGELSFEDVTEAAQVSTNRWCNGVSVVDINQDGKQDIYLSVADIPLWGRQSANLLFVNQGVKNGVPQFREMAAEYGLADFSYTVQTAFFDYDRDGDLDAYLLNNFPTQSNLNQLRQVMNDGSYPSTDRLYRNEGIGKNGHYVYKNVSKEMGIQTEGYGLGLVVSDLDQDDWPDVYCANDFLSSDLLYKNQNGKGFKNVIGQVTAHQSMNGMGTDIADFNNDGWADIVELDMLPEDSPRQKKMMTVQNADFTRMATEQQFGYQLQYIRNSLQLNRGIMPDGQLRFSEISQMAGVDKTDWSWSALLADYDNDGFRDLFITNGYRKDVTDRDFIVYNQGENHRFGPDTDRSKRMEALTKMIPEVKIPNYIYRNVGGDSLRFEDKSTAWGLSVPSYSNGAVYADLDNDGDLDLVVNNIDDEAFIYRNTSLEGERQSEAARVVKGEREMKNNAFLRVLLQGEKGNQQGIGAKVWVWAKGQLQYAEMTTVRGYQSSVEPFIHFGVGANLQLDSLRVRWPNGHEQKLKNVKTNQTLTLHQNQAKQKPLVIVNHKDSPPLTARAAPPYLSPFTLSPFTFNPYTFNPYPFTPIYPHRESLFSDFKQCATLPHLYSRNGFGIAVGDVNADKLPDFFAGGSSVMAGRFFVQQPNGTFQSKPLPTDTLHDDMGTLFFDADNDNDLDLYVASGGNEEPSDKPDYYQDRLYLNNGKGNFTLAKNALPNNMTSSKSCVNAADFDHDGDLDLFIGGRLSPRAYPQAGRSYLLRNDTPRRLKVKGGKVKGGKGGGLVFTDITPPALHDVGMVCAALWTDYDNDTWPDLLLAGEFMPLTFFKNQRGKLEKSQISIAEVSRSGAPPLLRASHKPQTTNHKSQIGWFNSLTGGDFDQDGDIDYVAGNLGLNTRYHVSPTKPLVLVAKDFNNDGSLDPVMGHYFKGELYPSVPRDALIQQMIQFRRQFKTYDEYSKVRFNNLFTPKELQGSTRFEANELRSLYVENLGNGQFQTRPLPIEAQMAPLYGMITDDVDGDGHSDVILGGNFYGTEVNMGRYDAFLGLWLKGDGRGNFKAIPPAQSGLVLSGDVKGLAALRQPDGSRLLLAGLNSEGIKIFTYKPKPTGKPKGKSETYWGSGYLSSSAILK